MNQDRYQNNRHNQDMEVGAAMGSSAQLKNPRPVISNSLDSLGTRINTIRQNVCNLTDRLELVLGGAVPYGQDSTEAAESCPLDAHIQSLIRQVDHINDMLEDLQKRTML